MFEVVKNQMIEKWLKYETTEIHPLLDNAEDMDDLFYYYTEVLSGSLEEFIENEIFPHYHLAS